MSKMGKRKGGNNEDNNDKKRSKGEREEDSPGMFTCGEEGREYDQRKAHMFRLMTTILFE